MPENPQQILLEKFTELLRSGAMVRTQQNLKGLHPAEIADLLESLPISQRRILWGLLNPEIEGEVLLEISGSVREDLIDITDPEELLSALEGLDTDKLADLFADLPATVSDRSLTSMEAQDRKRLEQVLSYNKDSAGGLMDLDAVTVRENVTLDIVLRYLRMRGELPQHTNKLIVVDHSNHYLGTLQLSQLLTENPDIPVSQIMNSDSKSIEATTSASEVARLFEDRNLISAPVIDENNRLLGRITVDDVVDVIRDEAHQAEFSAAGLPLDENLFSPAATSARRRALWLGINLATAFLAAWVISLFQDTLEKVIVLAVLIPVVASMGGIAGGQTLTLVIRGLATGQVGRGNSLLLLLKESTVGLLNSAAWALIVMLVTLFWIGDFSVALIIGAAMIVNLLCAALAGVSIPLLLEKLGIDPALAGGVLLTTITDVIGILAFLGLATIFLL